MPTDTDPAGRGPVAGIDAGTLIGAGMPAPLAEALAAFGRARPDVLADGTRAGECGPVAYTLATYLRDAGVPCGLIHFYGYPAVIAGSAAAVAHPDLADEGSGHYCVTTGGLVLDLAYRQFDPDAPAVVFYEETTVGRVFGRWLPWDEVGGRRDPHESLTGLISYTDPAVLLTPGAPPRAAAPLEDAAALP